MVGGKLERTMRKKSSIYLEEELDLALTHAAAKDKLTKAEFIRRALAQAVAEDMAPRFTGVGAFSGRADLARDVDRHLAESDFGKT